MNAWMMKPLPFTIGYANNVLPGYPAANVANDYAGLVWKGQVPEASRQYLILDMGTPTAIDTVMLFGCTGARAEWRMTVMGSDAIPFGSDTIYLVNSETGTTGGPFLAGAVMPSHGRGVGYFTATVPSAPRRYWAVEVTLHGGEPVTIARIAIGRRIQLARNFAFGAGFGVRDLGNVDFSPAGVRVRRRAAKLRTIGLTFPAAYKDEVEAKVQPLIEQVAGQEPIVLVTDPAPHAHRQQRCYFGHLFGDLGTVWRTAAAWEWRANLIDLIPVPAGS